jgi:hypothetical protein
MAWPEKYRPNNSHSETEMRLSKEARGVVQQYAGLGETISAWFGPGEPTLTPLSEEQVAQIMTADAQARDSIRNILSGRWQHKGPHTDTIRERLAWDVIDRLSK